MAIRTWVARPDSIMVVKDEHGEPFELPIVSREQMRELYLDGEAMQAHGGGVVTCYAERRRTGVPNEMVTVAAVFEWKDRADARPQPEQAPPAAAAPAPAPVAQIADADLAAAAEAAAEAGVELELVDTEDVVLDEDGEPDEDLSAIPSHLREAV